MVLDVYDMMMLDAPCLCGGVVVYDDVHDECVCRSCGYVYPTKSALYDVWSKV